MSGSTGPIPRWTRFTAPALVLLVAAILQWPRLDSPEQNEDEGWWITSGKVSWDVLFRHHRPDHPIWTDDMRTWGSPNPQLGKFLIGASVNRFAGLPPVPLVTPDGHRELAAGEVVIAAAAQMSFNPDYDFQRSVDENRAAGRVPPPHILAAARRGVLAVSLIAGALFWWLAHSLVGERTATVALLLWLANPALAEHSARAMTDVPALTGTLLGLVGAVALARHGRGGRGSYAALALSALGFGLGVATKLNVLAPVVGALLVALGWSVHDALRPLPHRGERRRPIAWLWALALLLVPLATSFASNPMLWTRPWAPIAGEPDRISILLSLGDTIETYEISGRLATARDRLFAAGRFLCIGRGSVLGDRTRLPFDAAFALLGLAAAFRWMRGPLQPSQARAALTFVAISVVTWTMIIAWLPFDRGRFYLPLLPAYCIASAVGAVLVAGWLAAFLRPLVVRLAPRARS